MHRRWTNYPIVIQTEPFSFQREGESWYSETDKSLDIDETKINNLLSHFASYGSDNKITGVTDLGEYGLDDPQKVITMSEGGDSFTIKIGAYNLPPPFTTCI